jgi:hypothetical protein
MIILDNQILDFYFFVFNVIIVMFFFLHYFGLPFYFYFAAKAFPPTAFLCVKLCCDAWFLGNLHFCLRSDVVKEFS